MNRSLMNEARFLREVARVYLDNIPLNMACISTFRDQEDITNFGFTPDDVEKLPDFFPWSPFIWGSKNDKVRGALYMIGSITEHVAGRNIKINTPSFLRARKQFAKATYDAVTRGARVILLAAATKRLFKSGELEKHFPGVLFTLGDNMTGLLLNKRIEEAARLCKLNLKKSRVLIIGPYGLLGKVASYYLTQVVGCKEVIGLGNPSRSKLLEHMEKEFGIKPAYSYDEIRATGEIDMVVACNSSPAVVLTPERVEKIRRRGRKLVVVDPSEPKAMPRKFYEGCSFTNRNGENSCTVIRFNAGNGSSEEFNCVPELFGDMIHKRLGLWSHETWGCFCEALILARNIKKLPWLTRFNWFDINPEQIDVMRGFFFDRRNDYSLNSLLAKMVNKLFPGRKRNRFALPEPACFDQPLADFVINLPHEPDKKILKLVA